MMRRCFISVAAALLALVAGAVPAVPVPVRYTQPDGTVVEVRHLGDEYFHYSTIGGRVVALGEDGFWHPAQMPSAAKGVKLRQNAVRSMQKKLHAPGHGSKHFLVLLVEFSDLKFTVQNPNDAFSRMLNSEGYSENGGTGSAADYFRDNSNGVFSPIFDVLGPVTLSGGFADYGGNDSDDSDKNPGGALVEACRKLDDSIDFSDYDLDGDGVIDNVFFYYAGHNEAEGGGADCIWPHASAIAGDDFVFDGVSLRTYACSSELRGANGSLMCGIGTFCHEFGHVLGLPDLYDVDYEENGSADAVYAFSLMCSGSYNNSGRTPPYLGALERMLLGWSGEPETLMTSGPKTIGPVYSDEAASTPASKQGEYFLYEYRDGSGWDRYILAKSSQNPPSGMLVYHVDMSQPRLWQTNAVNVYGAHPCYYIVKAMSSWSDYNDMLYPGTGAVSSFEGRDWSGNDTGYILSDISCENSRASFNLQVPGEVTLAGKVIDIRSRPLAGVTVAAAGLTAETDNDGNYTLSLPGRGDYEVTFSLEMYVSKTEAVSLLAARTTLNITLSTVIDGDEDSPFSALGFKTIKNPAAGGYYSEGEEFELAFDNPDAGDEPVSTVWYFDGSASTGGHVKLTKGTHTIKAVVTYADGSEEEIEQVISVR